MVSGCYPLTWLESSRIPQAQFFPNPHFANSPWLVTTITRCKLNCTGVPHISTAGLTDSASGPVVNPDTPVSSLAKMAAGDGFDLLVALARGTPEKVVQLSEQFFCVVASYVNDFGMA